jgi:hypothetical protein
MERDGTGVSALLGLDGSVMRAQLLEEASGEGWPAPGRSPRPTRRTRRPRPGRDLVPGGHRRAPDAAGDGIIDLDSGRLVDVLAARSATAVTAWLGAQPTRWLTGIDHVVIDPYQPDATAVGAGLPEARLVVDHFHVIRLANAALDEVRRRTQQTSLGHRGHKADPLYRIRRRLLAGHERLGPTGFARVLAWLDTGDPHGESAPSTWPRNFCARATSPSTPSMPRSPATTSSTRPASPGSSPSWMRATPAARSAPRIWPRSCCARPSSPDVAMGRRSGAGAGVDGSRSFGTRSRVGDALEARRCPSSSTTTARRAT